MFNSDFRNVLQLPELRILGFSLFHSPITQEKKKWVFKILSYAREGILMLLIVSEIVLLEE